LIPQILTGENSGTNRVNYNESGPAKGSATLTDAEPNETMHPSSDQATIRRLVSRLDQIPDARSEQVNTLRSEIRSGKLQRSNEQVADAIVTELLTS
jgi:anti-sigma28 factor (negative regulator of flagellin synthesis)